jgi:deoxyribonuclease-1
MISALKCFTLGLLILAVQPTLADEPPHSIRNFSQAKRLAAEVYADNKQTFYCGCSFNSKKQVDADSCGYAPRKNRKRGQRIEWEHVVPAHALGHTRQCWREPLCTTSKGKTYKGRRCCEKVDPQFRAMVSDLRNLVPAVGELNGDRSNFSFTMLEGEPRNYGACDFEVDHKLRKAEPTPSVRGDIARTYFYMEQNYKLPISDKQRRLFEAWDRSDPIDEWEQRRNTRIDAIVERTRAEHAGIRLGAR